VGFFSPQRDRHVERARRVSTGQGAPLALQATFVRFIPYLWQKPTSSTLQTRRRVKQ
jgi:hypothetical protein